LARANRQTKANNPLINNFCMSTWTKQRVIF
jgi:hypothetical protein